MIYSKASDKKTMKARSKPSEYEAMMRNGFLLPKLNSTIVNKIYMYRVKSGLEYCPMTTDIKAFKVCINPPSKEYLLCQIQEELIKKEDERDLTYDSGHLPDVEWCVRALMALNPQHHIFDKDYVPSAHEKCRKGAYAEQIDQSFLEEEEEIKRFDEFDKGLPSYLHQPGMKSSARFTGRPFQNQKSSAKVNAAANMKSMQDRNNAIDRDVVTMPAQGFKRSGFQSGYQNGLNDDTLTDHDLQDENDNIHNRSMSKMQMMQEQANPFLKQHSRSNTNNTLMKSPSGMQTGQPSNLDNPGSLFQPTNQQTSASKNLDLQQTLKQLNTQLFPSNISKNKSKKKLNSQEEEMIVSMFEKLVVNCKGRPVDFVKSYLDQYHSEKKNPNPNASKEHLHFSSSQAQSLSNQKSFPGQGFGAFNHFSKSIQSNSGTHSMSKAHQALTSPSKSKNLNFLSFNQQPIPQFILSEHQNQADQIQGESLPEDKLQNCDAQMIAQNGIGEGEDDHRNYKEMLQTEYEGSSHFTSGFNVNSETVQTDRYEQQEPSLSSFNPSQNSQQQLFNI